MTAADSFYKYIMFGILGYLERVYKCKRPKRAWLLLHLLLLLLFLFATAVIADCCLPVASCWLLTAGFWLLVDCWRHPNDKDPNCPKKLDTPNDINAPFL